MGQHSDFRFDLREFNGALGDLGTLLPVALSCIAMTGLSSGPVMLGFGLSYLVAGLVYRVPVPVQPMKAVAAVVIATQVPVDAIALSGVVLGLCLMLLGTTGVIDRVARAIPKTVLAGLQVGLGLTLGWIALRLLAEDPLLGGLSLLLAVVALYLGGHAALLTLLAGAVLGPLLGVAGIAVDTGTVWAASLPGLGHLRLAVTEIALPQLALTITNAVLLTSLLAREHFGDRADRVTPRRLCLSTGALNLLLCPFGALPMCHGAGGIVAHHRFGARTGGAPLMIGACLLLLALLPGPVRAAVLAATPVPTLGALLLIAAVKLADARRLLDGTRTGLAIIACTALLTFYAGPLAALITGFLAELTRKWASRR